MPERLSSAAFKLMEQPQHQLHFSALSLRKITIKRYLGRPDFIVDSSLLYRGLIENGYTELVIKSSHILALDQLPPIHKDPFDRMLVTQAVFEGMLLLLWIRGLLSISRADQAGLNLFKTEQKCVV